MELNRNEKTRGTNEKCRAGKRMQKEERNEKRTKERKNAWKNAREEKGQNSFTWTRKRAVPMPL